MTRVLATVAGILVLASIGGQFSKFVLGHGRLLGLVSLFYIDREGNIPSFFSALLLLFSAGLLGGIAVLNAKARLLHTSKWIILALGFGYMAYDEALAVHESLILPIGSLLGRGRLGVLYFAWVIPGSILVLLLLVFFLRFLLYLPAKTRQRFVLAGALYIGGAIGVEMIGAYYFELYGPRNFTYTMIATIEESLEMAGVIVFISSLLDYIADVHEEVRLQFTG